MVSQVTNYLTTKLSRMLQRLNPTSHSNQLNGELSFAVLSQPSIQHKRLKEVYTSLPDEHIETSFAKTERIALTRFRSSHHPAIRRWKQFLECPKMPSTDWVVRKSNLQKTYGYYFQRPWWNDTIASLAIRRTNSTAYYAQLLRF